jgi:hypothetical protein
MVTGRSPRRVRIGVTLTAPPVKSCPFHLEDFVNVVAGGVPAAD